jgi:hypothetical protein
LINPATFRPAERPAWGQKMSAIATPSETTAFSRPIAVSSRHRDNRGRLTSQLFDFAFLALGFFLPGDVQHIRLILRVYLSLHI